MAALRTFVGCWRILIDRENKMRYNRSTQCSVLCDNLSTSSTLRRNSRFRTPLSCARQKNLTSSSLRSSSPWSFSAHVRCFCKWNAFFDDRFHRLYSLSVWCWKRERSDRSVIKTFHPSVYRWSRDEWACLQKSLMKTEWNRCSQTRPVDQREFDFSAHSVLIRRRDDEASLNADGAVRTSFPSGQTLTRIAGSEPKVAMPSERIDEIKDQCFGEKRRKNERIRSRKLWMMNFECANARRYHSRVDFSSKTNTLCKRNADVCRCGDERMEMSFDLSAHLRSVGIEEVESGSVRVLPKIVRRLSLPVPCNAIQCQWLFVNNMDDHVRRMSHWRVWSSVLFVALIHRRAVPVHFQRYLFTHRSESMTTTMIDWLVETTKFRRCDLFTAQNRQTPNQSRWRSHFFSTEINSNRTISLASVHISIDVDMFELLTFVCSDRVWLSNQIDWESTANEGEIDVGLFVSVSLIGDHRLSLSRAEFLIPIGWELLLAPFISLSLKESTSIDYASWHSTWVMRRGFNLVRVCFTETWSVATRARTKELPYQNRIAQRSSSLELMHSPPRYFGEYS